MRRNRELVEAVLMIVLIAGMTALWTGSRADAKDEPKPKCPLCGNEEVSFENTPEGAFAKMRFVLATGSVSLLRECVTGVPEEDFAKLEKELKKPDLLQALKGELKSCKVDGDKATLVVSSGRDSERDMQAVKVDGVWRIDLSEMRRAPRSTSCVNNLRQLGVYMVMYISKYGSDRDYSGPGVKLFTDIANLPTPEQAIMKGNEGLLICPESGDKLDIDLIRKDDPACTSYECIEVQISDGTTQPQVPIAWDKKPCHDGKRNVLFFSGSVQSMTEEEFQALRAK